MKNGQKITPEAIKKFSYTDFVGFINQWNVLPGSYTTLSKWAVYSRLNRNSRLLEVACSTGFSSRELATLTGCQGEGFDLSRKSIEMANYNKKHYASKINFIYKVADGFRYKPRGKFTHIVVGASLKFFPNPEKMINRCLGMLNDGGYILASPFYVTRTIPNHLIKRAQKVFDITPTNETYKEIMTLFNKFEIIYEDRNTLVPETDYELRCYCQSTTERACLMHSIKNQKVRQAMFDRLFGVKKMSNDLRPYQRYSVLVLRFRKTVYPNRFTELF
ncbi:MAG: class I SAM-dependent methyltransferase [Patescibacteria group bacterium]